MNLHQQELVSSFEEHYANDLLSRLKEQLIEEHPSGIMPRDAHPKMHGLVEAEFTVHPDLSDAYKVGHRQRLSKLGCGFQTPVVQRSPTISVIFVVQPSNSLRCLVKN
jgi:hypothetical protein